MSEEIVHFAIADDSRLLVLASSRFCEAFKTVLADRIEKFRLGALTRRTEKFCGDMIHQLRDRCRGQAPQGRDADKLAFCLGTLTHRAADRQCKPLFAAQSYDGAYSNRQIRICQDVFIFDRIYGRGRRHPYRPDALDPVLPLPGGMDWDAATFEQYIDVLLQRMLLKAHTLKPADDAEAWLDDLFARLQEFKDDFSEWHRLLTEGDEELFHRAIEQVNFYNESDPLLDLLRDLRAGQSVSEDSVESRFRLGDKNSVYARCVSQGCGYIQLASEFWQGRMEPKAFADSITR
jgi:hypothetical protein